MEALLVVVVLCPLKDVAHGDDELRVVECLLSVTWDVDSVELAELFFELLSRHPIVEVDDSSPSSLQKLYV